MPSHVIRDRLWDSKKLTKKCSKTAALAYPWIFLIADDHGRFEYEPRRIWTKVFGALEDVSLDEVESWLAEYERAELLVRYGLENEYAYWTGFQGRPPSQRRPSHCPDPEELKEKGRGKRKPRARVGEDVGAVVGNVYLHQSGADKSGAEQSGDAREVFDYWRKRTDHGAAAWTRDRQRHIEARLAEEPDGVAGLKRAVDGAVADPWFNGKHPQRKGRNLWGFENIFIHQGRNRIERLQKAAPRQHSPPAEEGSHLTAAQKRAGLG